MENIEVRVRIESGLKHNAETVFKENGYDYI